MRRMGGGSGSSGGPMGIFNVGRSRAQLVDKDNLKVKALMEAANQ